MKDNEEERSRSIFHCHSEIKHCISVQESKSIFITKKKHIYIYHGGINHVTNLAEWLRLPACLASGTGKKKIATKVK